MVNGTPSNVPKHQMKFHVAGAECALVGTYHNGKPYEPNRLDMRASLPARWRKAFDRACEGLTYWHDNNKALCTLNLSDRKGRYLATVYCVPELVESR